MHLRSPVVLESRMTPLLDNIHNIQPFPSQSGQLGVFMATGSAESCTGFPVNYPNPAFAGSTVPDGRSSCAHKKSWPFNLPNAQA